LKGDEVCVVLNENEENSSRSLDEAIAKQECDESIAVIRRAVSHIALMLCEVARERDFFITDGTPKNQKLDTKALKEFSSVLKEISSVLSDLNARESVPVDMGVRIEFSPEALGYSS
jgi:hypothetical protein